MSKSTSSLEKEDLCQRSAFLPMHIPHGQVREGLAFSTFPKWRCFEVQTTASCLGTQGRVGQHEPRLAKIEMEIVLIPFDYVGIKGAKAPWISSWKIFLWRSSSWTSPAVLSGLWFQSPSDWLEGWGHWVAPESLGRSHWKKGKKTHPSSFMPQSFAKVYNDQ